MKYIRVYGNIIFVALLAILAIVIAPSFVAMIVDYLPSGVRSSAGDYSSLLASLVRLVILIIAAGLIRVLVRAREGVLHALPFEQSEGELEVYRGLTRGDGVAPYLAREVIQANSQMSEEDRMGDFHRAIRPNFAAELGYQLGVNSETRKMMQDFFAGADPEARRRFHTSTHVTMEGGRIVQTHDTHADVEPASRYAPREPENDPNWKGEVSPEELSAKIFGTWDEPLSGDSAAQGSGGTSVDGRAIESQMGWDIDDLGVEFVELNEATDLNNADLNNADAGGWSGGDPPAALKHVGPKEVCPELESESEPESEVQVEPETVTVFSPTQEPVAEIATTSTVEQVEAWPVEHEAEIADEDPFELPGYEEIELQEDEEWDEELDEPVSRETEGYEEPIPDLAASYSGLSESGFRDVADLAMAFGDDDEVFAQVESDPVIVGLIKAIELTRRLPAANKLRYLFAFYGSEVETLVSEFSEVSITHVEQIGSRVEPLFRYAGVKRHQTTAWVLNLSSSPVREDDLNVIVWVPVGIAHLGDLKDRRAWKLVPVVSGSSAIFYVLRSDAALAAARFEWILGNLYEDLKIDQLDESVQYFLPSLGVTITLLATDELSHGDYDIHGDADLVGGPTPPVVHDVSLLGDGGKKWFAEQLGLERIELTAWLGLLHMMTTLLMRVEPVASKELLGQWATPESGQGRQLIEMLHAVFGDAFSGSAEGWELSNVRLDLFWLEEVIESADSETSFEIVKDFFTRKFDPEILQWLLNLGAMDPRMRSGNAIQLDRLARKILTDAVALLDPIASGTLSEKLKAVGFVLARG